MTSLICASSLLSTIGLLEQHPACSSLQQNPWSGQRERNLLSKWFQQDRQQFDKQKSHKVQSGGAVAMWVGTLVGQVAHEASRREGRTYQCCHRPWHVWIRPTEHVGGISMRHHTWRKRQLNPAPSTTDHGSTKSSQHLEQISGDAAHFTAASTLHLGHTRKQIHRRSLQ